MPENYRTQQGYYQNPDGSWSMGGTYAMDQAGNAMRGLTPYGVVGGSGAYGSTPAAGGGGGFGGGGGAGGPSASEKAWLEEQRRLGYGALQPGMNYFGGALGQNVESAIGRTLSGADVPYTQAVQDRLFASQADLARGQEIGAQDMIRSQLAERGMEGSGAGLAAMLGAGRERSAANTAAMSEIQNRAQLENFGARERARQQGESFLSSRSAAEAPYRLKEADLRLGSTVFGQDASRSPFAFSGMRALGGGAGSPQQGTQMGLQLPFAAPQQTQPRQPSNGIVSRPAQQAVQGYNAPQQPSSAYTPTSVTRPAWNAMSNLGAAAQQTMQTMRQPFNIGQW